MKNIRVEYRASASVSAPKATGSSGKATAISSPITRKPCEQTLIVFLKAPRPGSVKTRLARVLGDEAACDAYRRLVPILLNRLAELPELVLCYSPDDALDEIRPWLRQRWHAAPQGDGDLGERLAGAFDRAFAAGARRVAVIGSDCP